MRLTGLWWWIDRWRKSTAYIEMTVEEQGAYRNLLDEACLRGGPLPDDDRVLAKACGDPRIWRRVRFNVIKHFTLYPDGWRNETLDGVLKAADDIRNARATAGRAGAERRWQSHGKDHGKTDGKGNGKTDDKPIANGMAKTCHPDPDPVQYIQNESLSLVLSSKERGMQTLDSDEVMERAGRLLQHYQELYSKYRNGAKLRLIGNSLEFQEACSLVALWDDARLEKLAILVLDTDDAFIARTDRSFKIFAMKATWADDKLKAWELENGVAL